MMSKKGKKMAPDLPGELVFFGILNKLPVKSLLIFRCVKKLWHANITHENFIQSHLNHAKENGNPSIIGLFQVFESDWTANPSSRQPYKYSFIKQDGSRYFHFKNVNNTRFLGDLNSIFCFQSTEGFEICNPSTREFLYQPRAQLLPSRCVVSYGFGFDPLKNQYKVVHISHALTYGDLHKCMVYTLGTNSWRDVSISSKLFDCFNHSSLQGLASHRGPKRISDSALYSNGALHWYFSNANVIVSFDIHYERFNLIQGPKSCPDIQIGCYFYFIEWRDSMCLAFHKLGCIGREITPLILYRYMVKGRPPACNQQGSANETWEKINIPIGCFPGHRIGSFGESTLYWLPEPEGVQCMQQSEAYAVSHQMKIPEGDLSLYTLEYKRQSVSCTKNKFLVPLYKGRRHSLDSFKFMHHIENLLSLRTFVPVCLSQVQVNPVSSL